MELSAHTSTALIDLDAVRHNFGLLCRAHERAGRAATPAPPDFLGSAGLSFPAIMPVVKADAYGHGHIAVSRALAESGATAFASGNVPEAALLRQGLSAAGHRPHIVSLLGPARSEEFLLAAENAIIPVMHCREQLLSARAVAAEALTAARAGAFSPQGVLSWDGGKMSGVVSGEALGRKPWETWLPIALKCNTGMSRLGFNEEDIPALLDLLRSCPLLRPILLLSHTAAADTEDGPAEVEGQLRIFARIFTALRAHYPILPSLCNSAGTLLSGSSGAALGADTRVRMEALLGPHVCRPGLALYGGNPFRGTSHAEAGNDLRPAMSVHTPVLSLRTLAPGQAVGYGHTWRNPVPGTEMPVAVIGIGYADGFSRGLSNKGEVCLHGVRLPVIGRISMQMTTLDLTPLHAAGKRALPGDPVYLMGGPGENPVSADELADGWGTISYEVLCLLGMNRREYTATR